jgi:hypothetical protein
MTPCSLTHTRSWPHRAKRRQTVGQADPNTGGNCRQQQPETATKPADLVTFYDTIGDVTWEDVGNGYFIDPARDVLLRLREHGPPGIGADQKAHGLVIGSNGGGLSHVMDSDGAVHRTRTASLDHPQLDKVADDLRQFLELLERSLTRFVSDGEPGYL